MSRKSIGSANCAENFKLQAVTSGSGKLKMALDGSLRFAWFSLFCVVFLGPGVGLSYPGKIHSKYVVGSIYCIRNVVLV
jgi:hypothetical protein